MYINLIINKVKYYFQIKNQAMGSLIPKIA